jgi:myo-inositol-1(or 4)-monophosphatase
MSHPPAWLATAIDIVLRAGAIQTRSLGGDLQIDKKGAIDLVTQVDVEVERMARETIAARFPGHAVLAEELENEPEREHLHHWWVFDPIDGTVNYAHGLPLFCASLALEVDGRPEVAAVYDPTRRELFTAERGVGAWLNGTPLRVTEAGTLLDAMLCTGFPYDVHETVDEVVGLFGAFIAQAQAVRRLGSAALDLCYVAAGRLDGFWEQRLHPWDLSAASLLVEEAGGRVTRFDGTPFDTRCGQIVASNGSLHDEMLAIIASREGRAQNRTD